MTLEGNSLFIANRGEIAVRVNKAAKALGLKVIQAHSEADVEMLAVKLADEAANLGPPAAAKSYLNIDKVIAAAQA
ncbi:MAG: biotin carboxylase N-terminal domain-containing protein, partial [Pseudomonadota bacterium]